MEQNSSACFNMQSICLYNKARQC